MNKLKVGDIIVVSNALTGLSEYPVLRIEGNKAITNFRDFHVRIYSFGVVYEFGKKTNQRGNCYWIKEN